MKKVDRRVVELESELASLKIAFEKKVSELKSLCAAEQTRPNTAEKVCESLRFDISGLQKKIEEQKVEESVINDFKKSKEYDLALANAGAPEIQRCWIIAEKHIKTNPLANWASFIDEFLTAKKAIEEGKGEPEPFYGPSPRFLPEVQLSDNPDLF